jgi:hypothetical protein
MLSTPDIPYPIKVANSEDPLHPQCCYCSGKEQHLPLCDLFPKIQNLVCQYHFTQISSIMISDLEKRLGNEADLHNNETGFVFDSGV